MSVNKLNIFKISKYFNVSIQTKTSKSSNKDYVACSICQSVKNQNGEYEKKYLNCFVEDLMHLRTAIDSALNEYTTENTNAVTARFKSKEEHGSTEEALAANGLPVQEESNSSDIDDEIPFN